jgi:hypothetical protein
VNHAQAEEIIHLLRELLMKISAIEHRLDSSPFVGRPTKPLFDITTRES